MPVTPSRKCYVFQCAACDGLSDTSRADTVTCSPACRVALHRHPQRLAHLQAVARASDVTVAAILRCAAVRLLCPELVNPIMAGTLTIAEAQPEVRRAYWALLQQHLARDVTPPAGAAQPLEAQPHA